MVFRTVATRPLSTLATAVSVLMLASACTSGGTSTSDAATQEPVEPVTFSANVDDQAVDVGVDTVVSVAAQNGQVLNGELTSQDGKDVVAGRVAGDSWVAGERLEPATTYVLRVSASGTDGQDRTLNSTFTTQQLRLDQQTYPSVAPLADETVGVGMPVIVTFDIPIKNRALFERNMRVTSSADVEGSWSWFSDRVVHYRPKEYWPANTKVNVSLKLNGLPAGDGIFGQQDQNVDFTIGRKAVSTVNIAKHTLTLAIDDKKVRTVPVTAGDNGHRTREGTKVIMEKFSSIDMDAATTGVDSEDPDYYNISDVRWAMRVTNSGEFLHAAPWSAGSQGSANVSHGCTGMSTANAGWLYKQSRRGDVVEFTYSPRSLEERNGWTDWNDSWADWTQRSALYREAPEEPAASSSAPA